MKNLVEAYRGDESVLAVDILYVVFVEVVLVADIIAWLCCVRQWRRLRERLGWLVCLGAGDVYLMAASLWINANHFLSSSSFTVCGTWLTEHSAWLTMLPLVDATGLVVLTSIVMHRCCCITREQVASLFILAIPWTLGLALVVTLALIIGVDPSFCEHFTYDRFMAFNASKLVYTLTVYVPIAFGLIICFIMFCIRKSSRRHHNSSMVTPMSTLVTESNETKIKMHGMKNSENKKSFGIKNETVSETVSKDANNEDKNEEKYRLCDLSNTDSSFTLHPHFNPHPIQSNAYDKQDNNIPIYEQNCSQHCFQSIERHGFEHITTDSYSPGIRKTFADLVQNMTSVQESQLDTPNFVSGRITVMAFFFTCFIVILPLTVANMPNPQLQESLSRSGLDISKLYKDVCMWVYYLRTSIMPALWIAYINAK